MNPTPIKAYKIDFILHAIQFINHTAFIAPSWLIDVCSQLLTVRAKGEIGLSLTAMSQWLSNGVSTFFDR
jgi:hypothetical protein